MTSLVCENLCRLCVVFSPFICVGSLGGCFAATFFDATTTSCQNQIFSNSTHRGFKLVFICIVNQACKLTWHLMVLVCISYIFLWLPVLVPGQLGFCLFLYWLKHEHLVYLCISCTLSEMQRLPAFNCAFLTPLWGPSNHLDRVEQSTDPWVGLYRVLSPSEKDNLRLLALKPLN